MEDNQELFEPSENAIHEVNEFGWGGFIFGLCQGDITKLQQVKESQIVEAMTFLRYSKKLAQGEKRITKTKRH